MSGIIGGAGSKSGVIGYIGGGSRAMFQATGLGYGNQSLSTTHHLIAYTSCSPTRKGEWNIGGCYDTSGTGRFTAPINGIYQFRFNTELQGCNERVVIIFYRHNASGTLLYELSWQDSIQDRASCNVNQTFYMDATDYVYCEIWLAAGTSTMEAATGSDYAYSYLNCFLISTDSSV